MAAKDFQSLVTGTPLTFPYDCGSHCKITAVKPIGSGGTGGVIAQSGNGFVGLAAGSELNIEFPSSTSAVMFRLWCGAAPTRLDFYASAGAHLGTISVTKGPLGSGTVAFAAEEISRAILYHDNDEGLLLSMQWDDSNHTTTMLSDQPEDYVKRAAAVAFTLTGAWRVDATRTGELFRARRAVAAAAALTPNFAGNVEVVIPSAEAQSLGTVGSIWQDCVNAANDATLVRGTEVAARIVAARDLEHNIIDSNLQTAPISLLGPFQNVSPRGQELVFVEVVGGMAV